MGYSYAYDEAPKICFNGAKSWQLGWYDDKSKSITPSGDFHVAGRIASIVDYPTADAKVLFKIKQSNSEWAYFLQYNAAKGFNSGTAEGRNKVMITAKQTGNSGNPSTLLSILGVGDSYSILNFDGKLGETLTVGVRAITPTEAFITIDLNGSSTSAPSFSPSISLSQSPSGMSNHIVNETVQHFQD